MKLKCEQHNRRVVVVGETTIHRTGDGSRCNSKYVLLNGTKLDNSLRPVQ